MFWWIALAIILYAACAALLVAEVFIPSGGILGTLSLLCLVGGLAIFFSESTSIGIAGIIAALIIIPTILIIAYKTLPKSKFGKAVFLDPPERQKGDAIPDTGKLEEMLGQTGTVITPLRPVGTVSFNGKRLECVSENDFIKSQTDVKVVKVEGTQLTVRPID